jgi:hypothetical protein
MTPPTRAARDVYHPKRCLGVSARTPLARKRLTPALRGRGAEANVTPRKLANPAKTGQGAPNSHLAYVAQHMENFFSFHPQGKNNFLPNPLYPLFPPLGRCFSHSSRSARLESTFTVVRPKPFRSNKACSLAHSISPCCTHRLESKTAKFDLPKGGLCACGPF